MDSKIGPSQSYGEIKTEKLIRNSNYFCQYFVIISLVLYICNWGGTYIAVDVIRDNMGNLGFVDLAIYWLYKKEVDWSSARWWKDYALPPLLKNTRYFILMFVWYVLLHNIQSFKLSNPYNAMFLQTLHLYAIFGS